MLDIRLAFKSPPFKSIEFIALDQPRNSFGVKCLETLMPTTLRHFVAFLQTSGSISTDNDGNPLENCNLSKAPKLRSITNVRVMQYIISLCCGDPIKFKPRTKGWLLKKS